MLAFQHDEKASPSACGASMARSKTGVELKIFMPRICFNGDGDSSYLSVMLQDSTATT